MATEHAPTASEYIVHHLTFLTNKKQVGLVDWSVFHLDTLFFSIGLGLLGVFILARLAARATSGVPGRFQAAVEIVIEMVNDQTKGIVHSPKSREFVAPLALTVFMWIFLMNAMDLLPLDVLPLVGNAVGIHYMRVVPTADLNATLGMSAAVLLLVIPAYVHHRQDIKSVVLMGEGLAVAAVIGAMTFVIVDLGRPDRVWHMIPVLGRFNWPVSMLAWDVVVLSGYLLLNIAIPMYLLYCHYRGREPNTRAYLPWVLLAILWAISIHTVTAFLFSANSARPFWNIALLAPRFIATAFVSGPALIILVLKALRRVADFPVSQSVIDTLALIMTTALQISIFFVGQQQYTGGTNGLTNFDSLFGMNLADTSTQHTLYYSTVLALLITWVFALWLTKSPFGRRREKEKPLPPPVCWMSAALRRVWKMPSASRPMSS